MINVLSSSEETWESFAERITKDLLSGRNKKSPPSSFPTSLQQWAQNLFKASSKGEH